MNSPLPRRRQPERDHRPSLGAIGRFDRTGVLVEDAVDDREPQAGPTIAAREEWLEYALQVARPEAAAAVLHPPFDERASAALGLSHGHAHVPAARRVLDGLVDPGLDH